MKTILFCLLLGLSACAQTQNRNFFIYEKIILDESPKPAQEIKEVKTYLDYDKFIIISNSQPRIYTLDAYNQKEVTLADGLTYQLIKAEKFIMTSEKPKFGNKTYRLQIMLPEGEANYELVEIIQN